ncbi:MAG TPA: ABC transporter permease [Clostridiales bacterium]|nr:ABC transporter permease [Clostridiales bacterium]HPV02836.1 ABC transporter permease [Clostridiales bacterium]
MNKDSSMSKDTINNGSTSAKRPAVMEEPRFLKLLDRFAGMFERSGIDYTRLRLTLRIKLLMDARRIPTVFANSNKTNEKSNYFRLSLFIYTLMGLFAGLILLLPFPLFLKFNIATGLIIFFLMSTMISDFSSVLLDVREKSILLPRPVDHKTMNAAKIIHILYYIFCITAVLAGPQLIIGTLKYGAIFPAVMIPELVLICFFVVFFTSVLYTFILVIFDGEKLKDIINYFQIVLSLAVLVFYQLIGRIFNISEFTITFSPKWWHYLLPTAWFAAPFSIFLEHDVSAYYLSLSAIALLAPVTSLVLYTRVVVPHFEKNLQKLNDNSVRRNRFSSFTGRLRGKLVSFLCRTDQERVFWQFTRHITANERKLKLGLYPSLAFSAVMPFIMMIGAFSVRSFEEAAWKISKGYYHFGLYITAVILGSAVLMLSRSENYKGAWIYKALPIETPVPIFRGAVKSFIARFIIPFFLFPAVIFVLIMGVKVIPDVVLIFFNMMILVLLVFRMSKKELPFSRSFQQTYDGKSTAVFLLFFLAAFLGGIHFALSLVPPFGVWANIAFSALLCMLLWRNCFRISWKDVDA